MYQPKDYEVVSKGIQKRVCPKCKHDAHEVGAIKCEACGHSLLSEVTEQVKSRNLRVVEKKPRSQKKRTRSESKPKKPWLLVGGIALLLLGGGTLAYQVQVNASPEAALRSAEGIIDIDGEPCSEKFMLQALDPELKEINSRLKFQHLDSDSYLEQIAELRDGMIQVAFSEKMFYEEYRQDAEAKGVRLLGIPYGYDAIAYITEKGTKPRPLTVKDIRDVYSGRITNWKQLDGKDQEIIPILMGRKWSNPNGIKLSRFSPKTIFVQGNRAEAKRILKSTPGAIFYTSSILAADELDEVNIVQVKKADGTVISPVLDKGVTNQEAVRNREYPLIRTLYVVVNEEVFNRQNYLLNLQQRATKGFVKLLVSTRGQAAVEEIGFVAKYIAEEDSHNRFRLPFLSK